MHAYAHQDAHAFLVWCLFVDGHISSNGLTCVGNSDDAADIRTCLRPALTAEALDDAERQGGVVGTNACAHTAPPITTAAAAAHLMILLFHQFLGGKGSSFLRAREERRGNKGIVEGRKVSILDTGLRCMRHVTRVSKLPSLCTRRRESEHIQRHPTIFHWWSRDRAHPTHTTTKVKTAQSSSICWTMQVFGWLRSMVCRSAAEGVQ